MVVSTIPETVTVPADLIIEALAVIDQFAERLYVLNGYQDTPEIDAIHAKVWNLVGPIFGLTSYYAEDGDTTHPTYKAIEDRSQALTAEWFARIADSAPVVEAVA